MYSFVFAVFISISLLAGIIYTAIKINKIMDEMGKSDSETMMG